jgi:hypothetical protein
MALWFAASHVGLSCCSTVHAHCYNNNYEVRRRDRAFDKHSESCTDLVSWGLCGAGPSAALRQEHACVNSSEAHLEDNTLR